MGLEMSERCQHCWAVLALDGEAYICSYECTFCPLCAGDTMMVCPNCAGELLRRPRRATTCSASGTDNQALRAPDQAETDEYEPEHAEI